MTNNSTLASFKRINMRFNFLLIVFTCLVSYSSYPQNYKQIHTDAILIDTHNDILSTAIEKGYSFDEDLKGKTHSDLRRMKEGGVDVQIFSVWCDGEKAQPFSWANREIDTLYAWAARNSDKMMIVRTSTELMTAVEQNKLGSMMGVEGGHMIEDDLSKLDSLYNRGVRYMTLTWNNSPSWASSAMEETYDSLLHQPKGLNNFGKQLVKRMNELGMMVDVSHVGEQTFTDVINITTKPVIASHSCAYKLCPVFRNLKDDQIKAIGKNGGVIHLNFYSGFVDSDFEKRDKAFMLKHKQEFDSLRKAGKEEFFAGVYLHTKYVNETEQLRPPLSMLLDHLDYIVKLIGVEHVGIGSDFDGISSAPQQLDDVTDLPVITQELIKRGYSKEDIYKILGENFIRVFKANEQ